MVDDAAPQGKPDADQVAGELVAAQAEYTRVRAIAAEQLRVARVRRENAIRAAAATGLSHRAIARVTGLSHPRVTQILNG
jgi:hypothetical protein